MLFDPRPLEQLLTQHTTVDLTPSRLAASYLRISQILAPVGPLPIGKSTLWQWVRNGKFPKPIKLSTRVTVWNATDVATFIADPDAWCAANAAPTTRQE